MMSGLLFCNWLLSCCIWLLIDLSCLILVRVVLNGMLVVSSELNIVSRLLMLNVLSVLILMFVLFYDECRWKVVFVVVVCMLSVISLWLVLGVGVLLILYVIVCMWLVSFLSRWWLVVLLWLIIVVCRLCYVNSFVFVVLYVLNVLW